MPRKRRRTSPRLRVINLQVLMALGFIIVGAVFFVDAVEHLSKSLGVSEVLLALVIAPVATELPEKFNSIIWVRQGKDTLAMGNITGAMVFQSAIPTSTHPTWRHCASAVSTRVPFAPTPPRRRVCGWSTCRSSRRSD